MSVWDALDRRWPRRWPLQPVADSSWVAQEPTYRDAEPAIIDAALKRAEARPSGNWYVFAASGEIGSGRPRGFRVDGTELVAWRDSWGGLHAGPGSCPHLGAPLSEAAVDCDALVCRWHGLRVGPGAGRGWKPLPCHDDGVLAWVRLDGVGGEEPLDRPVLAERPPRASGIAAVASMVGVCEPSDIVANRLDPWHGSWFHPYSFTRLKVLSAPPPVLDDQSQDRFLVEVTFRVAGRFGVPVRAEFSCPEPRTVVMRIVEGEGEGSVVETHATPLGRAADGRFRSAVVEAVVADSSRPGFAVARRVAPALRPLIRRTAARLWRDDLAYAERRCALRNR
ncbi:DUF5914 domain-containing protein [Saccharopolyspora sp. ID03-671]|uniref:DUF5914 domain-containing protein n=1 Tax=Saccharopolyspora sp. ID03-671 TaxID=3073066 RepID=UPI0032446DB0